MDAIALLKADHARVRGLFARFRKTTDRALKTRETVVGEIIKQLSVHMAIEEQVFYPAVKGRVVALKDDVLEAVEEHHIVKWTLSELSGLPVHDEAFKAKVTVLMETVEHHVDEEEKQLFPAVRDVLSKGDLDDLADALEGAKKVAPTTPLPRVPSHGVDVAEIVAAVSDKLETVTEKISATRDRLVERRRRP